MAKYRVLSRSGYQNATGETFVHGDVVEGNNLDKKFSNAFERVEDDAEPSAPVKPENSDEVPPPPKVAAPPPDEGEKTDATDIFAGAGAAGAKVWQKDDGTFSVVYQDGTEEKYDTSDEVEAAFAPDESKSKKRKK